LPVTILAAAVSQVFLAEVARASCEHRAKSVTIGVTALLAAVGVPLYLGLFVIGPEVFHVIFGPGWTNAGQYARWMAPALMLRLMTNTLSVLLAVGQRFGESIVFTMSELALMLAALWLGYQYGSVLTFVVASTAFSIPLHVASFWRFGRVVGVGLREVVFGALLPIFV